MAAARSASTEGNSARPRPWLLRLASLGLAAFVALAAAPTTGLAEADQPGADASLTPIALPELRAAVAAKTPIDHRRISGADLSAVMAGAIGPSGGCDTHRALIITSSTIYGDVSLEGNDQAVTGEAASAGSAKESADDVEDWLKIPVTIKNSVVNGPISLVHIGFSCDIDMSMSTFRNRFLLKDAVLSGRFKVDSSDFKATFNSVNVRWRATASFRAAVFESIVAFETDQGAGPSTFQGDADFEGAVFARGANFLGIAFQSHTDFRFARFDKTANFSNTRIGPGLGFGGPFDMTEFSGPALFRNATFDDLFIHKTSFKAGADFHFARGRALRFSMTEVGGRIDLSDLEVDDLVVSESSVAGDISVERASIGALDLDRTVFAKSVDLDEAAVACSVRFETLSFEGDLRLEDAVLPSVTKAPKPSCDLHGRPAFLLSDVTFSGGLYASRAQILAPSPWWAVLAEPQPRFATHERPPSAAAHIADPHAAAADERRLWRELQHGFEAAGNLDLKNYAAFRLARLEEMAAAEPQRSLGAASRWFWGYGLRPWRVLGWIGVVIAAFAAIYWTQLAPVATGRTRLARAWRRVSYALAFSARTALQLSFGYSNSANALFRAITTSESLIVKLLLACFFYALTQTSPLLGELVKKLLP